MNFSRNTNMVATLVATVLCGCPGLFGLCFGATTLLAGNMPGAQIDIFGRTDQASATSMGFLALCLSLIAIAMPVIIWFVTRRKGTIASIEREIQREDVPPATD
ncbi:MAG TPA: hypothetical protein VK900_07345 [Anaerolineales bacterium]|nr:hypothetical protein [Anaerolineales bacterium]